jgi:exopolyphosphatase/pppGpp-phosphohydrolase
MSPRLPLIVGLTASLVAAAGPAFPVNAQPAPGPICAIDMGSNTFRRIVGSFQGGKYLQRPIEKKTMGVGDDVAQHGRITDAKLKEIGDVLAAFKAACVKDGATRVAAIGTAAFRDAANGPAVVDIAAHAGVPMEIATERRESELAYLVGSLGRADHAVIDHGSRTIELVANDAGTLRYVVPPLGYRVAYDRFFAKATDPAAAVDAYRRQLERVAAKAPFLKGRKTLVGVEFGDMVEVLFAGGQVDGRVFTLAQLKDRLNAIASSGPSGFKTLQQTKDVDRALPRLVAAVTLLEALGYSSIELTERELGSGLIIEAGAK